MAKIDQVNELIRQELAVAVNREIGLPDALITIVFVDCSPDYKYARVGFSVLPDKLAGTALKKLKASSGLLASILIKKTKLRRLPHFNWTFDATEREASKIEELIKEIEE